MALCAAEEISELVSLSRRFAPLIPKLRFVTLASLGFQGRQRRPRRKNTLSQSSQRVYFDRIDRIIGIIVFSKNIRTKHLVNPVDPV